jgi:transposase
MQAGHVGVVREVMEFIKSYGKSYKKPWWTKYEAEAERGKKDCLPGSRYF